MNTLAILACAVAFMLFGFAGGGAGWAVIGFFGGGALGISLEKLDDDNYDDHEFEDMTL